MGSVESTSNEWKRICELASRLLDSRPEDWDTVLARECGESLEFRNRVLEVCRSYSEDDEFFGAAVVSPLALEDSLIGQRIGPWKILRLLGEGGMGRVYLVERADKVFTQRAALKLNREFSDPESVRRFHAERRILAMLEHPAIARAIDGGATPAGAPYLVMEYVEGGCPIDEFRPGSSVREKIRLFLGVVEAVKAAHRHQVAHRDLKPSNILVTPDGLPKILDFGIAKLFGDEGQPDEHTKTGHAALTPTYASPEQLLREPSSLASDIYSLGAVLYKMLAGRPPHDLANLNILQSVRLVTELDAARPSTHARDLDADVDAIVLKALERNPARRYASAAEFADDLRRYLSGIPVKARGGAVWYSVSRFVRRHRNASLAAGLCLAALGGLGAKAFGDRQLEHKRIEQVRKAAGPVISDYQSQLAKLTGSTVLRNQIAADEKKYLDGIYPDAAKDTELRRLLASAYGSLATYETEKAAAQESLRKALSLWREILKGPITNPERLEMAGVARRLGWSQIAMGKLTEAASSLKESLGLLDALRGTSSEEGGRKERVMLLFELSRLGAWGGKGPEAIEYAKRAVAEHEKLPYAPLDRHGIALTRMQLADVADTYGSGDSKLLAEALKQTRMAVQSVREAPRCEEWSCRDVKAAVLTRAPIIYIHQGLIEEALGLRDGVDLAEVLLAEDPGNTSAITSLRFGLLYLGWILNETGELKESLKVRRRLLELSVVLGNKTSAEDRLNEAIACIEVGRTLVRLKRLQEAQGYFDRGAEILEHPPTENVYWFMRQADVYQDLGLLNEMMARPEAARTEFAKASAASARFLAKTGSTLAKEIEARSQYLEGKALLAVDKTGGCGLLRKSVVRLRELKASGPPNEFWDETERSAAKAMQGCGLE